MFFPHNELASASAAFMASRTGPRNAMASNFYFKKQVKPEPE